MLISCVFITWLIFIIFTFCFDALVKDKRLIYEQAMIVANAVLIATALGCVVYILVVGG